MAGIMQLVLIVGIFVVFYFILIRPQQRQQKILRQRIANLKKGDRIVTAGGMFGEYQGDKENGKVAIIKVGDDVKLEIIKSTISTVLADGDKIADSEAKK